MGDSYIPIAQVMRTLENIFFVLQQLDAYGSPPTSEWLYIALCEESQSTSDKKGNIRAGNSDWTLSSKQEVALHFAEFHSDEINRKRTALISATNDPLRAIKRAYWKRYATRNPDKIYIYIVQSSKFFWAKELLKLIKEPHLKSRLSRESWDRLMSPQNESLHDTEVVFLHQIPSDCIKTRVSLHDLLNRKLVQIIPALKKKHPTTSRYLSPKGIRDDIITSNGNSIAQIAEIYKKLFCILAQEGGVMTHDSLRTAQELLRAYQLIEDDVKTRCAELFRASLSSRTVVIRRGPRIPEDDDDDD